MLQAVDYHPNLEIPYAVGDDLEVEFGEDCPFCPIEISVSYALPLLV